MAFPNPLLKDIEVYDCKNNISFLGFFGYNFRMEKTIHLVSVKRYAEMKGIDRSTAQRWIKEGRIQRYYIPKLKKGYLNPSESPKAR